MAYELDPVKALETILVEHGPLDEDTIERRLRDLGVTDADKVLPTVLDETSCPATLLPDDTWVWLPAVLAGRVFTHRIEAHEATLDVLTVTPDLGAITFLCEYDHYAHLADGSPVSVALTAFDEHVLDDRGVPPELVDDGGVLVLPPGTMRGLGLMEGKLVGMELTSEGLTLTRVLATRPSSAGPRLAATLNDDDPVSFDSAVWTACSADPTLFREPAAPLSEIVDACGLVRRGDLLAPEGFDFERWRFDMDCEVFSKRYDIDEDEAFALRAMVSVYEQMSEVIASAVGDADPGDEFEAAAEDAPALASDGYRELFAEFGPALADPRLAEAFVSETLGRDPDGAAALGLFAETLEPQVPRRARVAFRWLRAVALEGIGDIEAAERELLNAESMDTDWPLPLFDLARIASDRGDVERGLALLGRAGAGPDDPLVTMLSRYRVQPRPGLGRNEPCWCGSGRKYKKCHLDRQARLALPERAGWLYGKAAQHAVMTDWIDLLAELHHHRTGDDEAAGGYSDPLLIDAVLFEGGALDDFLTVRGRLLPDDERLLAEQWMLMERSVFDIEQVRSGQGVTVRDVRTGDVHDVSERTASRQLRAGQLICTRVLPVGDGTAQFFGGVEPVALHERNDLIALLDAEPGPVELVAFLSRKFAPPTLTNTEGDHLTICESTARVSDPKDMEAALDATYDRIDGAEPPQWLEHVRSHGMEQIRATLALDGNELRVETNSAQRMDRVLASLERLDPAMSVLDDTRTAVDAPRMLATQMPTAGETTTDPDDPEVAAALDAWIRQYEIAWLDEPIPALDGHTPRQAADDPTRRPDLIRLLDTFPTEARPGAMSTERLRAALGLS